MKVAFAVVPPMSKPMALFNPMIRASSAAPIMPATGPDSIIHTGWRRACSTDIVPPLERMICSEPRNARPVRNRSSSPR